MSSLTMLRFAGEEVVLDVHDEARRQIAPVLDFVRPHFSPEPIDALHASCLRIEIVPFGLWEEPTGTAEITRVRRARREERHLWGKRWHRAGRKVIAVDSSQTVFDLAEDGTDARVYVSDSSHFHVTDFIRDLFWELALSGGAGHFVHAAAVSGGMGAVAFVGAKGAGKTTTALDFIHAGADFYSGDVLFVDSAGSAAHSFPDYPGICWGTLRVYPKLFEAAVELGRTPAQADSDKILLPHDFYWRALGVPKAAPPLPLQAIVSVNVTRGGAARLRRSDPAYELLEPMHRKTSDPGQGWQPFLVAMKRRRTLAAEVAGLAVERIRPAVPWYERSGRGRLDVAQISDVLAAVDARTVVGNPG